MQTTRTLNRTDGSNQAHRRRAVGLNLIVIGLLSALAAMALLILTSDPGGRLSPSPEGGPVPADTSAPRTTSPADQDRSWLCDIASDDSGPGRRAAVAELLASEGVMCPPGHLADSQPTHDR